MTKVFTPDSRSSEMEVHVHLYLKRDVTPPESRVRSLASHGSWRLCTTKLVEAVMGTSSLKEAVCVDKEGPRL